MEASDSDDSQHQSYVGCKRCKGAISSVYYDYRFFKNKFKAKIEKSNRGRARLYFRQIKRLETKCMELMTD